MAAFIKRLLEQGEREEDLVVFFHVVASSPQSFSVKNLLTRLCEFLSQFLRTQKSVAESTNRAQRRIGERGVDRGREQRLDLTGREAVSAHHLLSFARGAQWFADRVTSRS